MGLFDEPVKQLKYPLRSKQYRQDVDFLCHCDGSMCDQPHDPDRFWCLAHLLFGLFVVKIKGDDKRWMLCKGCHDDIVANGIKVAVGYPGSRY